jgi:uncharacterized protein YndB with AHSA1/START domain
VIDPLRVTFDVACPPDHAFDTWALRFATWWPPGHTVSGHPDTAVVLEPVLGGRIFERAPDGVEVEWGRITTWERPERLAYRWHIRRDAADATDVEITFVGLPEGTTRVEIVHTGWERLGAAGPAWRDANAGGWNGLLPHFVEACTAGAPLPANDKEIRT